MARATEATLTFYSKAPQQGVRQGAEAIRFKAPIPPSGSILENGYRGAESGFQDILPLQMASLPARGPKPPQASPSIPRPWLHPSGPRLHGLVLPLCRSVGLLRMQQRLGTTREIIQEKVLLSRFRESNIHSFPTW